jgi:hypothetical protein
MSAVLDSYTTANQLGWRVSRLSPDTDTFHRGDVVIIVRWITDHEVGSAYALALNGEGVVRAFPNQGDDNGEAAVRRWLGEVVLR